MARSFRVTVVYDSKAIKCEALCGPDWSAAEVVSTVKQRVKERFGESVTLEPVDLSSGSVRSGELKERVNRERLSLPSLLIDNELRISGEFDVRQLLDAIDAEREIKWKDDTT